MFFQTEWKSDECSFDPVVKNIRIRKIISNLGQVTGPEDTFVILRNDRGIFGTALTRNPELSGSWTTSCHVSAQRI